MDITAKQINQYITKNYCKQTEDELSDKNLQDIFLNSPSVSKKKNSFLIAYLNSLSKVKLTEDEKMVCFSNFISSLNIVPAGTKASVRGNYFNKKIVQVVEEYCSQYPHLEIGVEKFPTDYTGDTRPDLYIKDLKNNKTLIFYNQLDFWSGGQQIIRGKQYTNLPITDSLKFLLVLCRHPGIIKSGRKLEIFQKGLKNRCISYITDIPENIHLFFNLN